jgi:hypothetical protein
MEEKTAEPLKIEQPAPINNNQPSKVVHHYARTIIASLFGIIAMCLIIASILVVWVNQTLTNTNTYMATVTPLVDSDAIQNYVAQQASKAILSNIKSTNLATTLLPPGSITSQTTAQINSLLTTEVNTSVLKIIKSPQFATLWYNTNQSAQMQLVSQLKSNSGQLTLNLSPLINGTISELKTTELAPLVPQVSIPKSEGVLNLKGGAIDKAHKFYEYFEEGTYIIVAATLLCTGLCILISVHHIKTFRRIVFGTGIISLIMSALLETPSLIKFNGTNQLEQRVALAIAATLFHRLQLATLIIGISCMVIVFGSKLISKFRKRKLSVVTVPKA